MGGRKHGGLRGQRRILLVHNSTVVDNNDAIAHQRNLRQLAGVEQDGRSIGGQFSQQRIDLVFGMDIDAPRRIKAEQRAKAGHQPAANYNLLLVSAGEPARLRRRPGINR